jgi:hypothetical protein
LRRFRQQQEHLLLASRDGAGDANYQGVDHRGSPLTVGQLIDVHETTDDQLKDSTRRTDDCDERRRLSASVASFVEQRARGLHREARCKRQFLQKNLEYVARRERNRAHHLAVEIAAGELEQATLQKQYQWALKERQKIQRESSLLAKASKAAIGSRERRGAERLKRNSYGGARAHSCESLESASEAYVWGIPVDGTVNETFLRSLFEPYGVIHKVHLYRDKISGQVKGDALIVFRNDEGSNTLLPTVCAQVRHSIQLDGVMHVTCVNGAFVFSPHQEDCLA